jgi:uncharacterized 2Fe-2S/4Fe-4S cluster protein (DUF4445 family)
MVGLVPYAVRDVYQIGNTSLALARDVLLSEDRLWELEDVARSVRGSHVMFCDLARVQEGIYQRAVLLGGGHAV